MCEILAKKARAKAKAAQAAVHRLRHQFGYHPFLVFPTPSRQCRVPQKTPKTPKKKKISCLLDASCWQAYFQLGVQNWGSRPRRHISFPPHLVSPYASDSKFGLQAAAAAAATEGSGLAVPPRNPAVASPDQSRLAHGRHGPAIAAAAGGGGKSPVPDRRPAPTSKAQVISFKLASPPPTHTHSLSLSFLPFTSLH